MNRAKSWEEHNRENRQGVSRDGFSECESGAAHE